MCQRANVSEQRLPDVGFTCGHYSLIELVYIVIGDKTHICLITDVKYYHITRYNYFRWTDGGVKGV